MLRRAQLGANGLVGPTGLVSFGKQDMQHRVDGGKAGLDVFATEGLDAQAGRAQLGAGSAQAFVDVGLAGEQAVRNLRDVEAAQGLEGEDESGLLRGNSRSRPPDTLKAFESR